MMFKGKIARSIDVLCGELLEFGGYKADGTFSYSSSSIGLSCDRSIASSKVLERDYPGKVVMW
jgi:hypothetical protein